MNDSQNHHTSPYADIIHLPRPIIKNHPPMSRDARAAQFAPYAALVGHKEIIAGVEAQNLYQEPEIIPELSEEYPEDCAEENSGYHEEYPETFN